MCRAVDAGRAGSTAPEEFVAAVCALLPIMCCVLETLSMMLLTLPVIDSSLDALGIDPIRCHSHADDRVRADRPVRRSEPVRYPRGRRPSPAGGRRGSVSWRCGAGRGAVRRPDPVDRLRRRGPPGTGPVPPLRLKAGSLSAGSFPVPLPGIPALRNGHRGNSYRTVSDAPVPFAGSLIIRSPSLISLRMTPQHTGIRWFRSGEPG